MLVYLLLAFARLLYLLRLPPIPFPYRSVRVSAHASQACPIFVHVLEHMSAKVADRLVHKLVYASHQLSDRGSHNVTQRPFSRLPSVLIRGSRMLRKFVADSSRSLTLPSPLSHHYLTTTSPVLTHPQNSSRYECRSSLSPSILYSHRFGDSSTTQGHLSAIICHLMSAIRRDHPFISTLIRQAFISHVIVCSGRSVKAIFFWHAWP